MQQPVEAAGSAPEEGAEPEPDALAQKLGIGRPTAQRLMAAGLTTAEAARAAPASELESAGLSPEEIQQLQNPPASPGTNPEIVDKWMRSVRRGERGRRRPRAAAPAKGSTDVLRKWVAGDDRALEVWIQSSEPPSPAPAVAPSPAGISGPASERRGPATVPASGATALPPNLVEREETVVRWLTDLLDRVKSDRFDPSTLIQEYEELQRSLFDEREKHRVLEEELEHVKRGSIAVIKYVRGREAKAREELLTEKDGEIAELKQRLDALIARLTAAQEGKGGSAVGLDNVREELESRVKADRAGREAEYAELESGMRRKVAELEGTVRTLRAEAEARATAPAAGAAAAENAERALSGRELELIRRESELRTRFEEIRIRAEEIERKREAVNFKDREITDREEELALRRQALEVEARRVEEVRGQLPKGASAEFDRGRVRLEGLEQDIARREQELRQRETFLTRKIAEVEGLQKKAVADAAELLKEETVSEVQANRVRTGVRRLDDLMFGGVPVGTQILVNGPAHTGKDILARLFIAEGLRNGQGALWVITDRTYAAVRDEMTALLPSYPEYEKRNLIRYIDIYSRSLGVTEAEKGIKLLASNDKALLEQLTAAVNGFAAELKEKGASYRMVFESVSTVTAYLDSTTTFRFLQPLVGRRKLDGAAGYYELETGMHSDSDLQTLEHMMDGSINLKVDQLKTFLSIRGITDVQSRAWVGYTFSKKAFTLGSFSLDHIR